MPINSVNLADQRLHDPRLLTEAEVAELLPWTQILSNSSLLRLESELMYKNITAIHGFEQSSNRVSRWMIALVVVQTLATMSQVVLILCGR